MISPKIITLSFLIALSAALPQHLQAAEMAAKNTAIHKLQRGFVNIALSPVEISAELHKEKKVDNALPSWATGFFRGSFYTVGRALSGVYDILTFPLPVPANYESLVEPGLPWDRLNPGEPYPAPEPKKA